MACARYGVLRRASAVLGTVSSSPTGTGHGVSARYASATSLSVSAAPGSSTSTWRPAPVSSSSSSSASASARRTMSSTARLRAGRAGRGGGGGAEPDPGGKPNDGSWSTVYDDFYNITSAPPASSTGPAGGAEGLAGGGSSNLIANMGGATQIASMDDGAFTLDDGLVLSCPILLLTGGGGGSSSSSSSLGAGAYSGGRGGRGGEYDVGGGATVLMWDVPPLEGVVLPSGRGWERWEEEQEGIWKVLELVQPRPEILIFGTGKTVLPLPARIKAYLNSLGVQVDVQNTRAACSTYNLLVEEGRRVGAALIPNVRQAMPREEE